MGTTSGTSESSSSSSGGSSASSESTVTTSSGSSSEKSITEDASKVEELTSEKEIEEFKKETKTKAKQEAEEITTEIEGVGTEVVKDISFNAKFRQTGNDYIAVFNNLIMLTEKESYCRWDATKLSEVSIEESE